MTGDNWNAAAIKFNWKTISVQVIMGLQWVFSLISAIIWASL